MINSFIQKILGVHSYFLIQHKTGKDNITYELVKTSGENIIIQQMSSIKSQKNKKFIEKVVEFTRSSKNICLAQNYTSIRFYDFSGIQFQVMQRIPGNSIQREDVNLDVIIQSAEYLANFHLSTQSFGYEKYSEVNYYRKLSVYKQKSSTYIKDHLSFPIVKLHEEMISLSGDLKESSSLPIGVIHGDPAFKNFLIDREKNIVGLIDYDMMSVTTILWDIADLIRSYLKIDNFDKKSFHLLLKSYTEIRELSNQERLSLEDYCKMMVLDTGFRYIISYFDNSNLLGGKQNCLNGAKACIQNFKKLTTFF